MSNKAKFGILAMALLVSAGVAYGATLTGTPDRVATDNSNWSKAYWDQSTYPSPGSRRGTIIRVYDFSVDGGAAGTISLERGRSGGVTNIPDNTIIVGGFIDVITAPLPITATNTLGINTATDIRAFSLTNATGFFPILAGNGTNAAQQNIVKATNNMPFNLTVAGSALTQGFFTVYLDCYYGQ